MNYSNEQEKTALIQTKLDLIQGSIPGPLYFLIYMNDHVRASVDLTSIMFADETNLLCFHSDLKISCENVNNELKIDSTVV